MMTHPRHKRMPMVPGLGTGPAAAAAIRRTLAKHSLIDFTRMAWPAVEQADFVDNWHLHVLCSKLEAVTKGEIQRLLIMLPPRHSKSRLVCIFWPAWTWLQSRRRSSPLAGPSTRFIFCSYSYALTADHCLRLKWLISSPIYAALRGYPLKIRRDIDRTDQFEFEDHGGALATSIGGSVTGFGGHIRVMDDAHSLQEIDSLPKRDTVKKFYDEVWPSRVIDPQAAPEIVIMQRSHQDDLAGHILASARSAQFDVLCLPMEFDPDHPYRSPLDPRTSPGELLDLNRFGPTGYRNLTANMTNFAKNAQMNQNPIPRGGALFKDAQWRFAKDYPRNELRLVRYWDKAATQEGSAYDPDYTAGVLAGRDSSGRFWIVDIQRGRWSPLNVENRIRFTATQLDPPGTQIFIEEEPGSAGKDVTSHYQRTVLRGFPVRPDRPTGPKLSRAEPLIAAAEAANVILVEAPWNTPFLSEIENFTGDDSQHDDQVVATIGAFAKTMLRSQIPLVW